MLETRIKKKKKKDLKRNIVLLESRLFAKRELFTIALEKTVSAEMAMDHDGRPATIKACR
jgi:hypothetical protein